MKKLFRFKYEPCNGTCYAWDDDFYEGLKDYTIKSRYYLAYQVENAHDKLCDNPDYFFGLDKCEKTGLFIGHFVQPTRTDIFTCRTLYGCINEMTKAVLNTEIPKKEGQCNFGSHGTESLAKQILSACAA